MVEVSRKVNTWSLVVLLGLTGLTGCSSSQDDKASAGAKTDPAIQPLVGVWEIDCGNGFVQFRLDITADQSGRFDWQTYTEPGSKNTTINRMDLRLAPVNGAAEATVIRADVSLFNGKKMKISAKDADSVVLHAGEGEETVVDMDYTLFRESAQREVDCGGD